MALTRKELAAAVRLLKAVNAENEKSKSIFLRLEITQKGVELWRFNANSPELVNFKGTYFSNIDYPLDSYDAGKIIRGHGRYFSSIDEITELVKTGELPAHLK